ncbi:hypothetical protein BBV17_15705 [Cytobacillus oceanisediminis]|uniref:Uncharacterized protein n=1 Tax=Cytobacillus oceanisediminis TaxID=665099 RepID=A0ABX3CUR5_9BACI|nr:hypothetical protein BBV17_15705 [Cytobacillus oceanisediminis]
MSNFSLSSLLVHPRQMATSLILPALRAFITAIHIKKATLLWIAFQGIRSDSATGGNRPYNGSKLL